MKMFLLLLVLMPGAAALSAENLSAAGPEKAPSTAAILVETSKQFAGFGTNGPGVYRLIATTMVTATPNLLFNTNTADLMALTNRLDPAAVQKLIKRRLSQPQYITNRTAFTNQEFVSFVAGSLNHAIAMEIFSRTNGKGTAMWSERNHPLAWPLVAPTVHWNTNCLAWGMKGLSAISPCWQMEGASGQVPITLLTRRHGYARGHGMGHEGYHRDFNGKKVWFLSPGDELVEVKIAGAIVRCSSGQDYTVLLFSSDVPKAVDPMRAIRTEDVENHLRWIPQAPPFLLQSEQNGNLSAGLPGFTVPTFKGGDSGSPDMIPLKNELIFSGGRTTSRPSPQMQADMDLLCSKAKLDSAAYQIQWVDLSAFPTYK